VARNHLFPDRITLQPKSTWTAFMRSPVRSRSGLPTS